MTSRNLQRFATLKSGRLVLRRLVSEDEEEIFALRSDGNVNKYLDREPAKSIDEAKTFIQSINERMQNNDGIYWAITLKGVDKLIGTVCLFGFSEDGLKAEIGFELLPGFHGKGIMHEAVSAVIDAGFLRMGLKVLEGYCRSDNLRSIRLLEKFKFKKDGEVEGDFVCFKLAEGDW